MMLPNLQLSSNTSSKAGDIGAPNTVYFGGFGMGAGGGSGDIGAMVAQYWPFLVAGAVALILLRRK